MSKEEFIVELAIVEGVSPAKARERADYLERTFMFSDWHEAFVREVAFEWGDCRMVGMTDEEHAEQLQLCVSAKSGSWNLPGV